jgi:drug/metabolite transporter superfamily protein YnfA
MHGHQNIKNGVQEFTKYYSGDQMKKEMGGAYATYSGQYSAYRVWWRNMRDKDHVEDIAVDGTIILK